MCDFRPRMTKMHRQDLDRPPNVNVRPHVQGLLKNVEDLDQKVHQIDETTGIAGKNFNFFKDFFFTENVFFVKIETKLFIFNHKMHFFFQDLEGTKKRRKKFVNNICWENVPSLQNVVPILTMLNRQKSWNCVNFIY